MNRFGNKVRENASSISNIFFHNQGLEQQFPLHLCQYSLFSSPLSSIPQYSYDFSNDSDEEELENQRILLMVQQNMLLGSLINEIERNLNQVSTISRKDQEIPDSITELNAERLRRSANGIKKRKAGRESKSSSSKKIKISSKLSKRKILMMKKMKQSRKIAQQLLGQCPNSLKAVKN